MDPPTRSETIRADRNICEALRNDCARREGEELPFISRWCCHLRIERREGDRNTGKAVFNRSDTGKDTLTVSELTELGGIGCADVDVSGHAVTRNGVNTMIVAGHVTDTGA